MAQNFDQLVVELTAKIDGLQAGLNTAGASIKRFENQANTNIEGIGASFRRVGAIAATYFGTQTLISLAKSTVDAGMRMQALENRMIAATGSARAGGEAVAFLRAEAQRLGLSFEVMTESFAGFSASALRNGFTMEQSKQVFTGLSEALTALHINGERASLAFLAIEQMAGKGVVQLQEVRQLVNALPGALEIMANAVGVSTQQFNEMISKGGVLAQEALPKLGEALHREFGQRALASAQTAQAALARFENAVFSLKADLAASGMLEPLTGAVQELNAAVTDPAVHAGLALIAAGIARITEYAVVGTATIARWAAQLYSSIGGVVERAGNMAFGAIFGQQGVDALNRARQRAASGAPQPQATASGGLLKTDGGALPTPGFTPPQDFENKFKEMEEQFKRTHEARGKFRQTDLANDEAYQTQLTAQQKTGLDQRLADWQEAAEGLLGIQLQMQDKSLKEQASSFAATISQASQHNKAFFALEKAAAIARALISARQSVVDAYAFGTKIGGPAVGAAFAAVAAAAQAANIAAIAQTQYGGNGGSVSAGDGGSALITGGSDALAQQRNAQTGGAKVINIHIDGEYWGPKQARDLSERLNEWIGDGTIRLNMGSTA